MLKSKVHFWTLQILLVLLIIYVSTKVSFIFQPFFGFITTLFFPILISGILFFIFNPIVRLLEKNPDIGDPAHLSRFHRPDCLYVHRHRTDCGFPGHGAD